MLASDAVVPQHEKTLCIWRLTEPLEACRRWRSRGYVLSSHQPPGASGMGRRFFLGLMLYRDGL